VLGGCEEGKQRGWAQGCIGDGHGLEEIEVAQAGKKSGQGLEEIEAASASEADAGTNRAV
jgi:hypothetical protein